MTKPKPVPPKEKRERSRRPNNPTPTDFRVSDGLWLVGLGIEPLVNRAHRPTDNAQVERCHGIRVDQVARGASPTSYAMCKSPRITPGKIVVMLCPGAILPVRVVPPPGAAQLRLSPSSLQP